MNRHSKIVLGIFSAGFASPLIYRLLMKKLNIGKSVLQNKAFMAEKYGQGKFGLILYYLISGLSCSTLYAFIYARNDGLYHFSKSDLKPDSYSNFIWASFLKNPSMKTLVISQKGRFELD